MQWRGRATESAGLLGAVDESVRGHGGVQDFLGGLYARHGEGFGVDEAELHKHGGLVPIDVLVGELPVSEVDDGNEGYFDSFAGGRDAW